MFLWLIGNSHWHSTPSYSAAFSKSLSLSLLFLLKIHELNESGKWLHRCPHVDYTLMWEGKCCRFTIITLLIPLSLLRFQLEIKRNKMKGDGKAMLDPVMLVRFVSSRFIKFSFDLSRSGKSLCESGIKVYISINFDSYFYESCFTRLSIYL